MSAFHTRTFACAVVACLGAAGTAAALPPSFIDLRDAFPAAQGRTDVRALTPDGTRAVGSINLGTPGNSTYPVQWDLVAGTGTQLAEPAGITAGTAAAWGISEDGHVISGAAWNGTQRVLIRWVDGVPSIVSGTESTDNFGLSGDGQVAVGRTQDAAGAWQPSRWTVADGVQILPPLLAGESPSNVRDASLDGGVLVGVSRGVPASLGVVSDLAAWWDTAGQVNALPLVWDWESQALAVSRDGRYVVGSAAFGNINRTAVRWDLQTGGHEFLTRVTSSPLAQFLGYPQATALTADGAVVALVAHEFGLGHGAALWSQASELRSLKSILEQDYGLDLSHWWLSYVSAITQLADGSLVVIGDGAYLPDPTNIGTREFHSFRAVLPALTGPGKAFCDVHWQAPPALSNPGITNALPLDTSAEVRNLVSYNGEMYALGSFQRAGGTMIGEGVARWNGTVWSSAGTGLGGTSPIALEGVVFDDGSGPALYVAGGFSVAGGQFASGLARWNGSQWSVVGTSGIAPGTAVVARKLAVYDDGSGPALYVAGRFTSVDGVAVNGLARWNGTAWSSIGSPDLNDGISAMVVHDDGTGPALYVSGDFSAIGGVPANRFAKWNGTIWSEVGGGLGAKANFMLSSNVGGSAALYLVGDIFDAGGAPIPNGLIRWTGSAFESVAELVGRDVKDIKALDDGQGPALLVSYGQSLYKADEIGNWANSAANLLRWDGQHLTRIGGANEGFIGSNPGPLLEYDSGSGPTIYIAGKFTAVVNDAEGGLLAGNVAQIARCAAPPSDTIFANGFEM